MTTPEQMNELIEQHIKAEMAGDAAAAVEVYTDDVVHDVVGWPTGPVTGLSAARDFYDQLISVFDNERMDVTSRHHGADFCVVEHLTTGTVTGVFMGIPGNGRRVSFRMLHVFEFRGGHISRENVWLDGGAIVAQLTA
jgi:steroid delta-isomerase-like uncharacterized protein